ncbi:hypothetical protein [Paraburkholderia sp. SIMBA_054]|uniref:hypothetical protein n=1 Tax=Paraburkholderia sp. SIMBA_054 TaxID=3085795 RepID=UPI00397C9454
MTTLKFATYDAFAVAEKQTSRDLDAFRMMMRNETGRQKAVKASEKDQAKRQAHGKKSTRK